MRLLEWTQCSNLGSELAATNFTPSHRFFKLAFPIMQTKLSPKPQTLPVDKKTYHFGAPYYDFYIQFLKTVGLFGYR